MEKQREREHFGTRKYFQSGNLQLSYLERGEDNQKILLLLHGHMNDARNFLDLASRFTDWRVIALDQRGHGYSEHAPDLDYSRESYILDIKNLIQSIWNNQLVTILGHSLGGVNAYQFAARYPEWVQAVIVEDIGVELNFDFSFVRKLSGTFPTMEALKHRLRSIGVKAVDYFSQSVIADEKGWRFLSDLNGVPVSTQQLNGSWWEDWKDSTCPILLVRGGKSFVLDQAQAEQMVLCRPNTQLEVFEHCGHGVHEEDPDEFYEVVRNFLEKMD